MSEFNNVSIKKAANVYFDGKVTSRTITFGSGETKTLGIMLPGEYTFNTGKPELMEIMSGDVEVKLADQDNWQSITGGESFDVAGNSSFQIKVNSITDYCCSFLD
ncbi:MAG: pyrimidine/purine nucleoside phosphorylase [Gammaproteobacteria bacterium]|nr:pyrimidine/purine nucleoside phosphorylase [Gammaproteobacteria bacterium]MDH5650298.1 pyrimidine/purine nucleoside phosphorylase [Gammaproteobacteria bacterium]